MHRLLPRSVLLAAGAALSLAAFALGPGGTRAAAPAVVQQASPSAEVNAIKGDLDTVLAQGYEPFQVQVNVGTGGAPLIAISGTAIQSADGYNQWVFFFLGDTYLGTDTATPSFGLQIVGNAGPGAINVQYTAYGPNDPLCCPSLPPVVIT